MNKIKLFNDPVHGMIRFHFELLYDLIDHPYFQRLRRIRQMGMSSLVYPGANHSRFEHALGALHLMTRALDVLRSKKVEIDDEEYLAACLAILCHDIGHGPYSHALEFELMPLSHEEISVELMKNLSKVYGKAVLTAIEILNGRHPKPFLCQLVSSQLDMDRLDYLTRDSFFTGVVEGKVGFDRLIVMLNVRDNRLVMEEKGIHSIEKFLLSRYIMYQQVYHHKTSLIAESMLRIFVKKCIENIRLGQEVHCSDDLRALILASVKDNFNVYEAVNQWFVELDDVDILFMMKKNQHNSDPAIRFLSKSMLQRNLFKVYLQDEPLPQFHKDELTRKLSSKKISGDVDLGSLVFEVNQSLEIYSKNNFPIRILKNDGQIVEFSECSEILTGKESVTTTYLIGPQIPD